MAKIKNPLTVVGSGGATAPYVEYTYDEWDEVIVGAKMYGFEEIPDSLFNGLADLVSVDFAESPNITCIGRYAFAGCESLELTDLPSGITTIGRGAFMDCASLALTSLPNGITSIDGDAFSGCESLALTALPSALNSIGSNAFNGCTSLALTSLPNGLRTIGLQAFSDCTSLAISLLPGSLTSIGNNAFSKCTNLSNVEIACAKLGTGTRIFSNCTGLRRIWLRSSCTTITASSATTAPFYGCPTTFFNIYAEPASKPDGWGAYFNRTGTQGATEVTVTYNQTTRPW